MWKPSRIRRLRGLIIRKRCVIIIIAVIVCIILVIAHVHVQVVISYQHVNRPKYPWLPIVVQVEDNNAQGKFITS